MHSMSGMGVLVALTLLFGQTAAPAASAAVPPGCEKKCEKKHVPCRDRVDQQMMCFEVVRRCELRCPKETSVAKAPPREK